MNELLPFQTFLIEARRINRVHWVVAAAGLARFFWSVSDGFRLRVLALTGLLVFFALVFEALYAWIAKRKDSLPQPQKLLLNVFFIQALIDLGLIALSMHSSGGPISAMPMLAALYIGSCATMVPPLRLAILTLLQVTCYILIMEEYRQDLASTVYSMPLLQASVTGAFITWAETTYTIMVVTVSLLIGHNTHQLHSAWQEAETERVFLQNFNTIIEETLTQSDAHNIYQSLVDHVGSILGADNVYITQWDDEKQDTIPVTAYGELSIDYHKTGNDGRKNTITRSLSLIRKPLAIEDALNSPFVDPEVAALYPSRSVLGLPLFDYPDQRFFGAVLIGYTEPHKFTETEIRHARQVTSVINLINNRVRLQHDAVERASLMQDLIGHLSILTVNLQQDTLIPAVVEAARGLLNAQRAALYLFDPETAHLQFAHSVGLSQQYIENMAQVARKLPGASILSGERHILIADIATDPRARQAYDLFAAEGFKSYAIFALDAPGESVGALAVYWDYPHTMSADEISIANLFTDRAAVVLQKNYLYRIAAEQSMTDPLTGLPNRRALDNRLNDEIQRTRRFGKTFAFIMLDLDGFKRINDGFGHPVGDTVLTQAAATLQRMIRSTDMAARFGGDEFAVILPETNLETARKVWEKVALALAETRLNLPRTGPIGISASMGIAIFPDDASDAKTLIEVADRRLYAVKGQPAIKADAQGQTSQL